MTNALYQCVGENFRDNVRMGHCGKTHTLTEWIKILFPNEIQKALEYFDGYKDSQIVTYLFNYKGKRLKKVKKGDLI